jgi:hypothetical protein
MRILKRKKVKLNYVIAALLSCFCMMLVTPFVGEQFGFANSFSNIYLDGEHIGAIKDPVNVESLFLDEGFGTLDAKSLDIVLDTLTNLKESGKTIGIISHVEALKERIDKKILLSTSCGVSQLSGIGISGNPNAF